MYHIGVTRSEVQRIQQLITHLDTQPLGPGADRRVNPRIDFSHPMWINLPTEPGKPWVHIFSRNLSTGGLAFLTRKLFYNGQHIVISHELKEKCPQLVLCKICFCRSVEMGIMEVGLTFVSVAPDPSNLRQVPPDWTAMVLRSDWFARQKLPDAILSSL